MAKITLHTALGDIDVDALSVCGPFAVTPAVTYGGILDDYYTITHIDSGASLTPAQLWFSDADAAARFIEQLAASLLPGDLYQDEHGTWRGSKRLQRLRDTLLEQDEVAR